MGWIGVLLRKAVGVDMVNWFDRRNSKRVILSICITDSQLAVWHTQKFTLSRATLSYLMMMRDGNKMTCHYVFQRQCIKVQGKK